MKYAKRFGGATTRSSSKRGGAGLQSNGLLHFILRRVNEHYNSHRHTIITMSRIDLHLVLLLHLAAINELDCASGVEDTETRVRANIEHIKQAN